MGEGDCFSLLSTVSPAPSLSNLMGLGQCGPLLSDNLGSFLKVQLHWVTPIFSCGEIITLAPKPLGFTSEPESGIAESRKFLFCEQGALLWVCILGGWEF